MWLPISYPKIVGIVLLCFPQRQKKIEFHAAIQRLQFKINEQRVIVVQLAQLLRFWGLAYGCYGFYTVPVFLLFGQPNYYVFTVFAQSGRKGYFSMQMFGYGFQCLLGVQGKPQRTFAEKPYPQLWGSGYMMVLHTNEQFNFGVGYVTLHSSGLSLVFVYTHVWHFAGGYVRKMAFDWGP